MDLALCRQTKAICLAKPPDIAIGNEFVEEGGWAISRIGARSGGVDLGGVGTG